MFLFVNLFTVGEIGASPLPLHIEGQKIIDSDGKEIIFQGINFDHGGESYKQTEQEFLSRLSWNHSQEDYNRVKLWGINCVRLFITYRHIDINWAFDNLKKQIQWAKEAGLYIIIVYGGFPSSEEAFYNDIRNPNGELNYNGEHGYLNLYMGHWLTISNEFKNEPHVLYELINEPILTSYQADDETLYANLMEACIKKIRNNGDNQIIMIDGLSRAEAMPECFRFVSRLKAVDRNIIYTFHYYHPEDFVFQRYKESQFYLTPKSFIAADVGWQEIDIQFSTSDFSPATTTPILKLSSANQPGSFYISQIKILKQTDYSEIMSVDFKNKTPDENVNNPNVEEGLLIDTIDPCHSWYTISNTQGGQSAVDSKITIETVDGQKCLAISKTDRKDVSTEMNFAIATQESREPYCSSFYHPNLENGQEYILKLTMKGYGLTHYGIYDISFLKGTGYSNHISVWNKVIRRYRNWGTETVARELSSDTDMMNADISQIMSFANQNNIPMFLGEFGVPRLNSYHDDSLEYFRLLTKITEENNIGWALYRYRGVADSGDSRTFDLYAGWEKSVSDMYSIGLGTNIDKSPYFYRPDLINEIINTINPCGIKGDFDNDGKLGLSDVIGILQILTGNRQ